MIDYLGLGAIILLLLLAGFGLKCLLVALGVGTKPATATGAILAFIAIVFLVAFFKAMSNP